MNARSLSVWWDGRQVGQLVEDVHGDISFAYDPAWLESGGARPLSRSLPLRAEPFGRRQCRPFFAGLLPEAEQRGLVARALGVSEANDFALLDGVGGDVAGAITLLPEGKAPNVREAANPPRHMEESEFAELLERLPVQPLLAGEGLRLSLAGAQAKLPVLLVEGLPALPAPGQPTTHIVKPEIPRFEGSVANEAWCMQLARAAGLDVAAAEAREANGHPWLLVERYDRIAAPDGVRRLHQEDACQALGIPPERKYAAEGGPAFSDLFRLVREYSRLPALDIMKLVDAAVFNMIVGNADAHGKNFSFILDGRGPRLAPLYDLISTIQWPALNPRLAMRIGGRNGAGTLEELGPKAWAAFAEDARVTRPFLRQRVQGLARKIAGLCRPEGAPIPELAERTRLRAGAVAQSVERL